MLTCAYEVRSRHSLIHGGVSYSPVFHAVLRELGKTHFSGAEHARIKAGCQCIVPGIDCSDIDRYTFEAPTRFDKLCSGVASPRPAFITPGGTAGRENIGPNEGFEDYGRLVRPAFDFAQARALQLARHERACFRELAQASRRFNIAHRRS